MSRLQSIDPTSPVYQIEVEGRLESRWSDWFNELTIAHQDNATILRGPVADQAALRGLLNKLWDLNLILISLTRLDPGKTHPNKFDQIFKP